MTIAFKIQESVDVPEEIDAFERATWARLRWQVGNRVATRHVRGDKFRETIAVPSAPIATWLVENWWSLLYEPSSIQDDPIGSAKAPTDVGGNLWRHRHSIRSADSSLRLPDLRIFSTGRTLGWVLQSDGDEPPVRYVEAGDGQLSRANFIDTAKEFIHWTLEHLRGCNDDRADWLRERRDLIRSSTDAPDVAEFCRAAGRLGLDPYDTVDWPDGIAAWFELQRPGALDRSFAVDYLSSGSEVADLPSIANALEVVVETERLGAHNIPTQLRDGLENDDDMPAYARGYNRAERLRRDSRLIGSLQRVDHAELIERAAKIVLTSSTRTLPGTVASVAGWGPGGIHVVGRADKRKRETSTRFALARGLYLALWCAEDSPRLAVDACTDDHQAARAFAAELLAPRHEVLRAVEAKKHSMPFDHVVADVAAELGVDAAVVGHQVANARAGR